MKTIKTFVNAVVLAGFVSLPAFSAGLTPESSSSILGNSFLDEIGPIEVLSEQEMSDTKGELIPLIVAIAGIDLALMGFFWGVYVPTYGAGGCLNCMNKNFSTH